MGEDSPEDPFGNINVWVSVRKTERRNPAGDLPGERIEPEANEKRECKIVFEKPFDVALSHRLVLMEERIRNPRARLCGEEIDVVL